MTAERPSEVETLVEWLLTARIWVGNRPKSEKAARAILASDWLADHDARVRAEALREAANAIDSGEVDHEDLRLAGVNEVATYGWSDRSVIDAHDSGSVWRDWLRSRANRIEADR